MGLTGWPSLKSDHESASARVDPCVCHLLVLAPPSSRLALHMRDFNCPDRVNSRGHPQRSTARHPDGYADQMPGTPALIRTVDSIKSGGLIVGRGGAGRRRLRVVGRASQVAAACARQAAAAGATRSKTTMVAEVEVRADGSQTLRLDHLRCSGRPRARRDTARGVGSRARSSFPTHRSASLRPAA